MKTPLLVSIELEPFRKLTLELEPFRKHRAKVLEVEMISRKSLVDAKGKLMTLHLKGVINININMMYENMKGAMVN